jgi:hypothetical protein
METSEPQPSEGVTPHSCNVAERAALDEVDPEMAPLTAAPAGAALAATGQIMTLTVQMLTGSFKVAVTDFRYMTVEELQRAIHRDMAMPPDAQRLVPHDLSQAPMEDGAKTLRSFQLLPGSVVHLSMQDEVVGRARREAREAKRMQDEAASRARREAEAKLAALKKKYHGMVPRAQLDVLYARFPELAAAEQAGPEDFAAAVRKDDVVAAEQFLDEGAAIDDVIWRTSSSRYHGRTALMTAACRGNEAMVAMLLRRGAQVDLTKNENATALMFTAFYSSLSDGAGTTESRGKCAKLLLKAGAKHNRTGGGRHNTALEYAREQNQPEVVKVLEAKAAGPCGVFAFCPRHRTDRACCLACCCCLPFVVVGLWVCAEQMIDDVCTEFDETVADVLCAISPKASPVSASD